MKNKTINTVLGLCALVFAAWLAVVLWYTNFGMGLLYIWPGVAFASVAFLLSALSLYGLGSRSRSRADGAMTEVSALPVLVNLAYLGIALAVNTVFILVARAITFPYVVINLVVLIGYVAVNIFAKNHLRATAEKVDLAKEKINLTAQISTQIGVLLQLAQDEAVRKALLGLKEQVDLGNNISKPAAAAVESKIVTALYELRQMMDEKRDAQILLNRIQEIAMLLKERAVYLA